MVSATSAAVAALCAAFVAIELFPFLDLQPAPGTSTSTPASTLGNSAVQPVLVPLASTVALFASFAFIYLRHAAAAVDASNRRISEVVTAVMCSAVGLLQFSLFVLPAGGVDGGGAQARTLRLAATDALPAAATVTFFLGITFIIAHIRAGGEGGGGGARPVPVPVELLKKMALGAAATLVGQVAVAIYAKLKLGGRSRRNLEQQHDCMRKGEDLMQVEILSSIPPELEEEELMQGSRAKHVPSTHILIILLPRIKTTIEHLSEASRT